MCKKRAVKKNVSQWQMHPIILWSYLFLGARVLESAGVFYQMSVLSCVTSTVQRICWCELSYALFCSGFTLTMNHLLIFFHGEDRVRSVNITYRSQEREYGAHGVRRKMPAVYVKTNLNVCHYNETNINWQSVCQNFRSLFFKKVPECSPTFACMSEQVYKKDTPWPFCIEVAIGLLDLLDFYRKI